MRTSVLAALVLSTCALADIRIIGGGPTVGVGGPLERSLANEPLGVSVWQQLYTSTELQMPMGARVIDVAFRKEGLEHTLTQGCDVELWMKNVTATEYLKGSTTTLLDATTQATKVWSGPAVSLPNTAGFVRFHPTQNSLAFDYSGGSVEVTVVSNCLAASTDGPIYWRYDAVADRGRSFVGAAAPGPTTVLTASGTATTRRVQTRLVWLSTSPRKRLVLRSGVFPIPPGSNFQAAAKNFAAGAGAAQRFSLWNFGVDPVTAQTPTIATTNGTAVLTSPAFTTVAPGERVQVETLVTPATAGAIVLNTGIPSDDPTNPTYAFRLQGTALAAAESQPNFALAPDELTRTNVTAGTPMTVELGDVPLGHTVTASSELSNYGPKPEAFTRQVTDTMNAVVTPVDPGTTTLNGTFDLTLATTLRPTTAGLFTTRSEVTVAGSTYTVVYRGTAVGKEIALSRLEVGERKSGVTDDLGRLPTGTKKRVDYIVSNVGLVPLTLGPAELIDATNCTATLVGPPLPMVLGPERSTTLALELTPTMNGPLSVTLRIPNDDADENPYAVPIAATVAAAPKLAVLRDGNEVAATTFATVGDNEFTLKNVGDAPLTIASVAAETQRGTATLTAPGFPTTLAPGASVMVKVAFAPQLVDMPTADVFHTFTLTVVSDAEPMSAALSAVYIQRALLPPSTPPSTSGCAGCSNNSVPGAAWLVLAAWPLLARRRGATGGRSSKKVNRSSEV